MLDHVNPPTQEFSLPAMKANAKAVANERRAALKAAQKAMRRH